MSVRFEVQFKMDESQGGWTTTFDRWREVEAVKEIILMMGGMYYIHLEVIDENKHVQHRQHMETIGDWIPF